MTRCTDIRSKPSSTSTTVACYAPLYLFCGKHLLAAKLRPANVDPAEGALEELQRVANPHSVAKKHGFWFEIVLTVRKISWLGVSPKASIMSLVKQCSPHAHESRHPGKSQLYQQLKESVTWYRSLWYKTLDRGANFGGWSPRWSGPEGFLPSSLPPPSTAGSSQSALHSALLSPGEMENFKATRTVQRSHLHHTFQGNQLRLWFSSIAYVLMMNALRQNCLATTELASAQWKSAPSYSNSAHGYSSVFGAFRLLSALSKRSLLRL